MNTLENQFTSSHIPVETLSSFTMSHTSRAILLHLLTRPEDQEVSQVDIAAMFNIDSLNELQGYIDELYENGFIK